MEQGAERLVAGITGVRYCGRDSHNNIRKQTRCALVSTFKRATGKLSSTALYTSCTRSILTLTLFCGYLMVMNATLIAGPISTVAFGSIPWSMAW